MFTVPSVFSHLAASGFIRESDILKTNDGFFMVYRSISKILCKKDVFDFPDSVGERLLCSKFFDDWYLYAVTSADDTVYGLVKLREQERDAEDGSPADADIPGVTVSFISFSCDKLINCLEEPTDENRKKLSAEINRVVVYKRQHHHPMLKKYFKTPSSSGAYLIAKVYTEYIASHAKDESLPVPECYKDILQQSVSYKFSSKLARLPRFIGALNAKAEYTVCDGEKIYIGDSENLTECERLAILATHTGNTSVYSFAAEVEYHARYLVSLAKIKIPFFGRSIYDSAIRADMTVGDTEFEGPAPFYRNDSKIVKRQRALHSEK